MNRRDLLGLVSAAGVLAVAGCLGDDSDDTGEEEADSGGADDGDDAGDTGGHDDADGDSDDAYSESDESAVDETDDGGQDDDGAHEYSDPIETVEAFVQAFHDGDVEAVDALLYEGGELAGGPAMTAEELREEAPDIEEIALDEEDGDTAAVGATLQIPDVDEPISVIFELTAVDGAFYIVDIVEDNGPSREPQVAFDIDARNGELFIGMTAGDAVPADELYIHGEGLSETGAWYELDDDTAADAAVSAGHSVAVEHTGEYTIEIVWDDGDSSAVLASKEGSD